MNNISKILAINPGSTSTKVALYCNEKLQFNDNVEHSTEELSKFNSIAEQEEMRKNKIIELLKENNESVEGLAAVVGRGGILPPVQSGAYIVNEDMVRYLKGSDVYAHASNLGAIIAKSIADSNNIKAYIYDPVTVDERIEVAKITGIPELPRRAFCHTLNSRAMARRCAEKVGCSYIKGTFIVVHLGGGVSVSVHKNGRILDSVSDDEGAFSPERGGRVQSTALIALCCSGKYSQDTLKGLTRGNAGIRAHLGTADMREVEKRIQEQDTKAELILNAMVYQLSKSIGEMATVVNGKIDAIVLTGGIAHSTLVVEKITNKISFLAPVYVFPGECEMEALAYGALRVLNGEEQAHEFHIEK